MSDTTEQDEDKMIGLVTAEIIRTVPAEVARPVDRSADAAGPVLPVSAREP